MPSNKHSSLTRDYYKIRNFTSTIGGEEIQFTSKPGFPNWNQISAADNLLAGSVTIKSDDRVLLIGCGHGGLGFYLSKFLPDGDLFLTDMNFIATKMCAITLKDKDFCNYQWIDINKLEKLNSESFDVVIIKIPKGRSLVRRWLLTSYRILKPRGKLYIAGANNMGIKSAILDTHSVFGKCSTLNYKKSNRVAQSIKVTEQLDAPIWADQSGIFPGTWYQFEIESNNETILIRSLPGVFAQDRLDKGTRILLDHIVIRKDDLVLDMGCGNGIIGIYAAKEGAEHVEMIDANLLATQCCLENITLNQVKNIQTNPGDLFSTIHDQRFSLILANPPFHQGRDVNYQITETLIQGSYSCLEPDGRLLIISNKFIRYDTFMDHIFSNVECIFETNKYRVLTSYR
jgi:16S rRNA (guanine1207-N2)-methyltransferase